MVALYGRAKASRHICFGAGRIGKFGEPEKRAFCVSYKILGGPVSYPPLLLQGTSMIEIVTERLVLRLVPQSALQSTVNGETAKTSELLGGKIPDAWFDDYLVALRFKQIRDNPNYEPWSIRAIQLRNTGQVIGKINCHDEPAPYLWNDRTTRSMELGYGIFAPWQRQGFATEAITGYCSWAASLGVESLILSISPNNTASVRLAQKLSAVQIGSQIDDIDGPEDIYFVPDLSQLKATLKLC
jgi:[ribosomal protein S5]-alanine N-acetyltransferase